MRRIVIVALVFAACSCKKADANAGRSSAPFIEPQGSAMPIDHPLVDVPGPSRSPKRMTVDMLAASLPIVAGPDVDGNAMTWTVGPKAKPVEALAMTALAPTLGKPDYMQTTDEPSMPTPLVVKFNDDMARDVCGKMVDADYSRKDAANNALVRFVPLSETQDATAIRKNLRYLMLRFLSEKIADTDDAGVDGLFKVFATVAAADTSKNPAKEAWRAVCVALFMTPSFQIY